MLHRAPLLFSPWRGLWMALPSIGTYVGTQFLGKAIGGSVQIGRLEPGYSNGIVTIEIHDLTMKGAAEGTIKNVRLQLNPWKGLYIKAVSISDFDIIVKDSGGKVSLIPVPVELAELRRGNLTYRGQKYMVRELKVKKFQHRWQPGVRAGCGRRRARQYKNERRRFLQG